MSGQTESGFPGGGEGGRWEDPPQAERDQAQVGRGEWAPPAGQSEHGASQRPPRGSAGAPSPRTGGSTVFLNTRDYLAFKITIVSSYGDTRFFGFT